MFSSRHRRVEHRVSFFALSSDHDVDDGLKFKEGDVAQGLQHDFTLCNGLDLVKRCRSWLDVIPLRVNVVSY